VGTERSESETKAKQTKKKKKAQHKSKKKRRMGGNNSAEAREFDRVAVPVS
jgi:hypothetical protein